MPLFIFFNENRKMKKNGAEEEEGEKIPNKMTKILDLFGERDKTEGGKQT